MIESHDGTKWNAFYNEEAGKIELTAWKGKEMEHYHFEPAEFRRLWVMGRKALKDV